MNGFVRFSRFILAGVILCCPQIFAQVVPFYSPAVAENVDYHSFAPIMLLRHQITQPFRKLPKNPILQPGNFGWDSEDVADPFIVQTADSLVLFYSGNGKKDEKYHIGYAVRDGRGWFWKKRHKIISGSGGEWDSFHQVAPVVLSPLLSSGGEWRVYYSGNSLDSEFGYQWGLAFLNRNREWEYLNETPLISLNSDNWDYAGQIYGDIIYFPEQKIYKMWYSGFEGPMSSLGLMESADGLIWQHHDQPIISRLPGVIAPDVIFNGRGYTMYFVQVELAAPKMFTKIFSAESGDGIHWQNFKEVLRPSVKWEKNVLMRPNLSYFEGRAFLYYCGGNGSWRIGAAYALPDFENEGRWQSKIIQQKATKITIKYEQPMQTDLQVALVDPTSRAKLALDLAANSQPLRGKIQKAVIDMPPTFETGNFQIECVFSTKDIHHSPVVYEISLESGN